MPLRHGRRGICNGDCVRRGSGGRRDIAFSYCSDAVAGVYDDGHDVVRQYCRAHRRGTVGGVTVPAHLAASSEVEGRASIVARRTDAASRGGQFVRHRSWTHGRRRLSARDGRCDHSRLRRKTLSADDDSPGGVGVGYVDGAGTIGGDHPRRYNGLRDDSGAGDRGGRQGCLDSCD